jgi:stage II sporulation protein D
MSVYTFTGSSDAASPTTDSIPLILSEEGTENVSETFDPLTPISDESLEAASDSDVLVLLDDNTVSSVPLETYVSRVVASEMPSDFSFEALKAQAVAARTYVEGRRMQYESGTSKHPEAFVCATTCCQVYRDESGLRSVKSDEWYENDFNKIKNAVAQTAGEMLYYNGELVQQPLFFSSAGGGRTENSEDVFASAFPYLRSVDSEYDSPEKYTDNVTTFPLNEALKKVTEYASSNPSAVTVISDNADASQIEVMSRTEGGGAKLVRFGSTALTGRQTRTVFNLPSSDMTVSSDGETVTFTTQGSGHRVGLSQYGADGMAQHGYSYSEILSHYYSGTTVH